MFWACDEVRARVVRHLDIHTPLRVVEELRTELGPQAEHWCLAWGWREEELSLVSEVIALSLVVFVALSTERSSTEELG